VPVIVATVDEAEFQKLLATLWDPGQTGKGVLLHDGSLRTWRTLDGLDPHHSPALDRLRIPGEDVAAYVAIETDGAVQVWDLDFLDGLDFDISNDAAPLVGRVLAADDRLRPSPPGWMA